MAHISLLARESADILQSLADHRRTGAFIPVVEGGRIVRFSSCRVAEGQDVPDPLSVADYIGGMEVLGFTFAVTDHDDGHFFTGSPEMPIPSSWNTHALRLEAAMDGHARREEIVAFLMEPSGPVDRLDPKRLAAAHRICAHAEDMVPVLHHDSLWAVNAAAEAYNPPGAGISVRDFVLNMEAIGASFELVAYADVMCLFASVGIPSANPLWRRRERELCDAFQPNGEGKTAAVIQFLISRGDRARGAGRPHPAATAAGGAT